MISNTTRALVTSWQMAVLELDLCVGTRAGIKKPNPPPKKKLKKKNSKNKNK